MKTRPRLYTLSLHDALPISRRRLGVAARGEDERHGPVVAELGLGARQASRLAGGEAEVDEVGAEDRKSTRLNSSHSQISYAVFCLKKKTDDGQPRDRQRRRP